MRKAPVFYSPELFDLIMLRVAAGESIAKICRKYDDTPECSSHVFLWVYKDAEHESKYAHAVQRRADSRVDRIDDYGEMLLESKITSDVARVLIDKEKWQAGKENKKYSDKVQVELTGKDGEPLSIRLMEAQQRLLKDITPQRLTIEHKPVSAEDLI